MLVSRANSGENLYQYSGFDIDTFYNSDIVSDSWYDQVNSYDFRNPQLTYHTTDFTQMVWKSTSEVGFGINGKFVVARYSKPGNQISEIRNNVFPIEGNRIC